MRKYYFFSATLFLALFLTFNPANNVYATLIATYDGNLKGNDYELINKLINDYNGKEGLSYYDSLLLARIYDWRAKSYQQSRNISDEDLEKILKDLEKTLEYDSWNESYYLEIASYYFNYKRDVDQSIKFLKQCLKIKSNFVNCQTMLNDLTKEN